MKRSHRIGLLLGAVVSALVLAGCQDRPAVPTVAVEPTEPVILVVVTATSQPTLAVTNTPEATITPLPSFTPITTATVTPTVAATATRLPTQPPPPTSAAAVVTAEPTAEAAATTAPAPAAFAAPQGIAPEGIFIAPHDTVKFKFTSVGPLASDQCYRFRMILTAPGEANGVDDYWVPQALCGNQANVGDALTFELKTARFRDEPNFGTLLSAAEAQIPPTPQFDMRWMVDVVRIVNASDPIHPQVEALSPASAALQNSFSR